MSMKEIQFTSSDWRHLFKNVAVFAVMCGTAIPLKLTAQSLTLNPAFTVNNATQTPIEGIGHDFIHDLSETVNPQNGQVSIRIAAPAPHERGSNYPRYAYIYDTSGRFSIGGYPSLTNCSAPSGGTVLTCDEEGIAPLWSNHASIGNAQTFALPSILTADTIVYNPSVVETFNPHQLYPPVYASAPIYGCQYEGSFTYIDHQGGLHDLNMAFEVQPPPNGDRDGCASFFNVSNTLAGGDANYKAVCIPASDDGSCSPEVADSHGNLLGGWAGKNTSTPSGAPQQILDEDSNGNNADGAGRSWSVTTFLNTSPQIPSNPGGPTSLGMPQSLTLPGISQPYTYQYSTFYRSGSPGLSIAVDPHSTGTCSTSADPLSQSASFTELSKLLIPTNSTTSPNPQYYEFGYDQQWGLVNSITYPTGATVQYTWGVKPLTISFESFNVTPPPVWSSNSELTLNGHANCFYQYSLPVVTSRIVSYNGSSPAFEQDFLYSTVDGTNGFWASKTTTVTTTDLIRPSHPKTVTIYTYTPQFQGHVNWVYSQAVVPVESSIDYQDGSGRTFLKVIKKWNDPEHLAAECDISDSGLVSGKFYQYQAMNQSWAGNASDQVTDIAEYDYTQGITSACIQPGSSTVPARETKIQYASIPSSSLWTTGVTINGWAIPTVPQINDRPQVVQVYDHGTLLSESDTQYDQNSIQPVSPQAYGHDESNYGTSQVTARGNATTITRKCFPGCTDATTTAVYDETGQVVQVTDPNGNAPGASGNHTTSLSYADPFDNGGAPPNDPLTGQTANTNAYITKITRPSTSGVQHISNYKYHYMFGELDYAKDENQQITTYTYNDVWGRPTNATYPDSGNTQISYSDTGPNPSVTKTVSESNAVSVSTETVEDGVGHPIESIVSTDHPAGQTETDTTYDGMGRVYTVSNPYISTSDPTYGVTSLTYDALGRKVQKSNPDGTSTQWCYDNYKSNGQTNCHPQISCAPGLWVDSADEDVNDHQSTTDAFGRLVTVDEPNGASQSPSMETDYSYDAANNLTAVGQWGGTSDSCNWSGVPRYRSFIYNSLSKLTSATNPESGTVTYSYDANGNVYTRTDARSIVTQYKYDSLNRLLSKTYPSNDVSATPSSCYQYDVSTVTNGSGRLSNEWTQAGQCSSSGPPSGYLTLHSIFAYDPTGRLWTDEQCTAAGCNKAAPCQSAQNGYQSYGYDLAGSLTCSSNGIASTPGLNGVPLTFTSGFDGGGHLSSVTSNWTAFPTNLFNLQDYGPAGPTSWTLGPNLNLIQSFNPRLWIQSFSAIGQTP